MIEKDSDNEIYIRNLKMEKKSLENKIKEIEKDIYLIDKLIFRRNSEQLADSHGETKNLKNSNRLFYEAVIIDIIKNSKNGLRTSAIHKNLNMKAYFINYNTLRSYITRMRDAGKIAKSKKHSYNWIIPE